MRLRRRWSFCRFALLLVLLFVLAACSEERVETPSENRSTPGPTVDSEGEEGATATPFVLPTLLPTNTPPVTPTETVAGTTATPEAQSTVDFEAPVVELRYRIPALQLDRRLEGNVSGQITVVDETQGVASIRQNQGGVLLELQEVLPTLSLDPVPEDCDECVHFSYNMPLANAEGEGWLQDAVMLASIENYTAALLGPHFPPGAVLGMRRSATAYDVAHSLALDNEGNLYRWLATAPEVAPAESVSDVAPALPAVLAEVDTPTLAQQYVVACAGSPMETLFLQPDASVESGGLLAGEGTVVRISCPAFSLSLSLLPLYLQLDGLMQDTLAGSGLPRPVSEVRLDAVVDYQRQDGSRLEMALNGDSWITVEEGTVVTTTLAAGDVLSVTTALAESGLFASGLEAYTASEYDNLLLVRGEEGILEAVWQNGDVPAAIEAIVTQLDELIEREVTK